MRRPFSGGSPRRVVDDAPAFAHEFAARGYAVVPGVLETDELPALRVEIDRLLEQYGGHEGDRGGVVGSGTRSDRLDPVIDLSSAMATLARDPRVVALAVACVGPEPRLLKDKIVAKPPGASGYNLHQDHAYWQLVGAPPSDLMTVVLCLDEADPENGTLEIFPNRHHRLLTRAGKHVPVSPRRIKAEPDVLQVHGGDAVLLHSLAPHRSSTNGSNRARRQIYFSYSAAEHGDLYGRYYERVAPLR